MLMRSVLLDTALRRGRVVRGRCGDLTARWGSVERRCSEERAYEYHSCGEGESSDSEGRFTVGVVAYPMRWCCICYLMKSLLVSLKEHLLFLCYCHDIVAGKKINV